MSKKFLVHLKGKKEEGERNLVYYPTHARFVEGLEDKIVAVSGSGVNYSVIEALPVQNGSLTYTGAALQCTWSGYDPTKLDMDGDYEATDAGIYTVGFTPRGNYKWSDGTKERKTTTWTIGKAAGMLSLSADNGTVNVSETSIVIATKAGDGEISVESNDTDTATATINGNTIVISGVSAGSAVITVSVDESTNHLAPIDVTYQVTVNKRQVTIPTVTDTSKTYNGSPQSPNVTNEPSSTYANVGNKSGTNAGNYTLIYTLTNTNMYEWTDGSTSAKAYPWTIAKAQVTIPTVTNTSKTYTGSSQSPTVTNEPTTTLAMVTGKNGTNAQTYTLSYTLIDTNNYEWSDGSIAPKTYPWTIAKAACTISLGTNAVNLTAASPIKTVTVTRSGDGTISASSTNAAVATVSGTTTLTITGATAGSATINVNVAEGTNHLATSTTIAVTSTVPSTTLNNNSWAVISEASQAGTGDLFWDVGDAKEITLNGKIGDHLTLSNQKLCVFILDFNYKMNGTAENNIIWGGFKTAVTEGVDVALADTKYRESSSDGTICFNLNHKGTIATSAIYVDDNYNYGGWKGCDLRYDILGATSTAPSQYNQIKTETNVGYDATAATLTNPKANTLLAALPSDLRNVLRLWTRWIDATGNGSKTDSGIQATVDAISMLTEYEIFNRIDNANTYEKNHQTQMTYYKNGNSKIRYRHDSTSTAALWWTASPCRLGASSFEAINSSGEYGNSYSRQNKAIAPAFKT